MITEEDYVPVNLWIRQEQMDKITEEAYNKSITIYSLIRKIIDYYYEHERESNEKN